MKLESLSVGPAPGITDAGLRDLTGLTKLRKLYLAGTNITDDGLPQLSKFTEIEILNLTLCRISDDGLDHLKGLSKLKILMLGYTKVTGSRFPEELRGLEILLLMGCPVTDAGMKLLKKELPNCQIGF